MKRTIKHHKPRNNSSGDMGEHHTRKQESKRARRVDKYGAVTVLLEEEIDELEEDYARDNEPAT
ncbi:MAG: hypothetical protein KAV42_05900 [Candidatus Krumholzibacteria bacterium]|nr:hypothetical protein [Candidatus Krumholzibacteria bacterium]